MKEDNPNPEQMTAKQRHSAASAEAALADVESAKFDGPKALQHFLEDHADSAVTEEEGRRQFAEAKAAAVQRKKEALLLYGESFLSWVAAGDDEDDL